MGYPTLVSVNVGLPRMVDTKPQMTSAIDKIPAHGPVTVGNVSLEGDDVADKKHHGGTYQAVHVFAQEDLAWWGEELAKPVRPGLFGENFTTQDLDLNACVLGEQWLVGTARFQVSAVRTPCEKFQRWMALNGYDDTQWVKRFTLRGRPGVYLAILDRGYVQAGDPIDVIDVPTHGLTAGTMFRALTTEPALLPLLLEVDGLPPAAYDRAERYVERQAAGGS